jgi:hypothetical protein
MKKDSQQNSMPDDSDHSGKYHNRIDFQDNQYLGDPIAILNDFDSVREIKVESDERSLDEFLKAKQPKTKGKVKRGAAERSFREVSPSGEWEPNLAYTIKQAAEFLQLSEYLVLKMCKNRTLKSSQHENAYRIKGSVILDYLEGK